MSIADLPSHFDGLESTSFWAEKLAESLSGICDVFCWDTQWEIDVDHGVTNGRTDLEERVREVPREQWEPQQLTIGNERYALIPFDLAGLQFLGVVELPMDAPEQMQKWLLLVQKNLQLQIQLAKANSPPTPPTRGDELDLMEDVMGPLGALSPEFQFPDVASLLLPNLATALNAQAIAVVPRTNSKRLFVAHGSHVGDLSEWQRIVESEKNSQTQATVFKRVCGVAYSSIRSFVIAPIQLRQSVFGWLIADIDETEGEPNSPTRITTLMSSAAKLLATFAFTHQRLAHKEQLLLDVVRSLVSAIDAKDPHTLGHSVRVAMFASLVAEGMELSEQERDEVYLSGLLHDVGKIGVPEAIFHQAGSLSDADMELVKQHPDHGWKILHRLEDLQHILPGVVHHHERYDGNGYPDQISGDEIPLAARILAAADAYDALTSERPYRKRKSHAEAMQILQKGAGHQWDPVVVETMRSVSERFKRISRKYRREAHPWRIPGSIAPKESTSTDPNGDESISHPRYNENGIDII